MMKVVSKLLVYLFLMTSVFSCATQGRNLPHYSTQMMIDVEAQKYTVKTNIYYLPKSGETKDSLEFLIHENIDLISCEAINLLSFEEREQSNKAKSIVLYFKNELEEPLDIKMEYRSVLKKEDAPWGIDQISEDWIELSLNSGWLPILSSYDLQFTADVNLEINDEKTFKVVSSGITKDIGRNKFDVNNSIPQIDLVLIASPAFYISKDENITIYDSKEDTERARFITTLGAKSYEWLNGTFGKINKIPPVKLAIAPRQESGYARKNFIVLNDGISVKDTLDFLNFMTHEFAHFWSSGANPLSVHRWLDESIAEYVAWKYIQKKYSSSAFNDFIDRVETEAPTLPSIYTSENTGTPSHAVMYRKGVGKLYTLEKMIGEAAMFAFLIDWFQSDVKETEAFLELLSKHQGLDIANMFRTELSK